MTRRWAVIAGLVLAAAVALVPLHQMGTALVRAAPAAIGAPPADLDAETVTFASESESTIHGWLVRLPSPRGVVLLLPGVRANRLSMVQRARLLPDEGYASLLMDFQATGESSGDTITFGWRERLDVLAAVRFLRGRLPDQPIGVIGTSLGGAATLLATPPLDVDAVVLEAVYPSIDRAVDNRLRMRLGPIGPWTSPLLLAQLRPRLGIGAGELRPIDHIGRLTCPVLVMAGKDDEHTTVADTEALFGAARQPKSLWLIPGAAHVDLLEAAGAEYRRRVLAFLEDALRRQLTSSSPGRTVLL